MGETRDYTTTTFTLGFGGKGKRAEGNNTSSRDTFVFTGISAESTVAAPNSSVHPPRKLPSKAQRQKMAGRGRGRGGFNPGQLKGATWEYDAGAILETKPSELFPPHPNLKKPAPLTAKERREINNYRSLQAKITVVHFTHNLPSAMQMLPPRCSARNNSMRNMAETQRRTWIRLLVLRPTL